ncbi:uncharacterized protein LOC120352327 [Nilaparvata lugens]|uniref:uncharacterized protein LOC120352327 n=1 Tax=Nilaparvata lugens TaxID=108931 RepID=UPI00193EAF3C|nr:uncharacterized protein LOC120352327 [Nilaparvata lugens]
MVLNRRGKIILDLCERYDLVILNGRTTSDELGEFMFTRGSGASVIDLCCVSRGLLKDINDFKVKQEIFSDNSPVEVAVKVSELLVNEDYLLPLPRYGWKGNVERQYQERVRNQLNKSVKSGICSHHLFWSPPPGALVLVCHHLFWLLPLGALMLVFTVALSILIVLIFIRQVCHFNRFIN